MFFCCILCISWAHRTVCDTEEMLDKYLSSEPEELYFTPTEEKNRSPTALKIMFRLQDLSHHLFQWHVQIWTHRELGLKVKVTQSYLTLCDPMDHRAHGVLQARILGWIPFPFSRGSSQPRSPSLQADSSPSELPGKLKNTEVGSLSLLQGNFLTQESNGDLLYCRQIIYQMNYQRSPYTLLYTK